MHVDVEREQQTQTATAEIEVSKCNESIPPIDVAYVFNDAYTRLFDSYLLLPPAKLPGMQFTLLAGLWNCFRKAPSSAQESCQHTALEDK